MNKKKTMTVNNNKQTTYTKTELESSLDKRNRATRGEIIMIIRFGRSRCIALVTAPAFGM